MRAEDRGAVRTYPVVFDCGHHMIYTPPTPMLNDIVFCTHCYRYRVVVRKASVSGMVWDEVQQEMRRT